MIFIEVFGTVLAWVCALLVIPFILTSAAKLITRGIGELLREHRRSKYTWDVTMIGSDKRYK